MSLVDAFKVGCVQCLALIPGTSRSGATIIGGLLFGLSRQAATEFSFFLALPTLAAAGAYQLYSARHLLSASDAGWFAAGFVAAFLSALLCVRWLLRYISRHSFAAFAWYRIAFGLVDSRDGLVRLDQLDGGLTSPGGAEVYLPWGCDGQDLPELRRALQVVRGRVSQLSRGTR